MAFTLEDGKFISPQTRLFLRPEDGLVVGYFESDDVAAAMAAMEDEEVNTRWQAEMAQYFVQPSGGSAAVLPQYFRLD